MRRAGQVDGGEGGRPIPRRLINPSANDAVAMIRSVAALPGIAAQGRLSHAATPITLDELRSMAEHEVQHDAGARGSMPAGGRYD